MGNDLLFQKSFKDFVSPAFQVLFRFFIEVTMFADQIDQRLFIQFHQISSSPTLLSPSRWEGLGKGETILF